jgi:hypothetical protein
VIFTGRRCPIPSINVPKKKYVAANVCIILPTSIVFVESGSIYPQVLFETETGLHCKRFGKTVWSGGMTRIGDVNGSVCTIHRMDADSSFLYIDGKMAYVRMAKKGFIRKAGDYILAKSRNVVWA